MNKIALLALGASLAAVMNAAAIPLRNTVDEGQLMAARRALDAEEQKKLQKDNKHVKSTEKYCKSMVQFRLGQDYHIKITDRRVPTPADTDQTKYSVAGNADGPDNLSFHCIVSVKDGIINLEHLNLYKVVRDTPKDPAAKPEPPKAAPDAPANPPPGKDAPGAKKPPVNAMPPAPATSGSPQKPQKKKPPKPSGKNNHGISGK